MRWTLTVQGVLSVVALIAAIGACGVAIWALREVVVTARSLRKLTDTGNERLVPLLDKADVTIDAANAELLRIDAAITRFEEASVRVVAATGTLSDIVQAPAGIVTGVADKVRRAWKDRKRGSADEYSPAGTEPHDDTSAAE